MLDHHLRMAWRSLTGSRLYTLLNITGLALGMTISFLLLLYVHHEYTFDQFNHNGHRLYKVMRSQKADGRILVKPNTPDPLAGAIQKDIPDIALTARTTDAEKTLISWKENKIKVITIAADSTIVDMFSFRFKSGHPRTALSGTSSIVLARSTAKAIFGDTDPMGQTLTLNNELPVTVNGIIEDIPANSSLTFQAVISWGTYLHQRPWMRDAGWGNYMYATWALLKQGADLTAANEKTRSLAQLYNKDDRNITFFLYPLTRLHLYNEFENGVSIGGRVAYVRLFLTLAISILIIACINFMNLATARATRRAKEVGVRKTMGAGKVALIRQFLAESLITAAIASILSLLLLNATLPLFNQVTHITLTLPYTNLAAWLTLLGITLLTGLLAGSYPAFILSSFHPIQALKGRVTRFSAAVRPRQALVVVQFTFAIGLILSSIFIYRQIGFIKDRPVGYDPSGLIEMPLAGALNTRFEDFRREAIEAGAITDATLLSSSITENKASMWDVKWPGQRPGEDRIPIDCMGTGGHLTKTYGLHIILGRDFDVSTRPADSSGLILNEAAVKLMRFQQPLGQELQMLGSRFHVIGVVRDFVWGSPYEHVKPAFIAYIKDWIDNIGLRLNPARSVSANLATIQKIYNKYNPAYPFEYAFTQESFAKKYRDEQLLGSISLTFTILAIFISCLGLFGLASYSAEQKRKEMGIRKVLGATVPHLWLRMSGEFAGLILISFVLASTGSFFSISHWLEKYTLHTTLNAGAFVATLVLSLLICLASVSWQALKAAIASPVTVLRSE